MWIIDINVRKATVNVECLYKQQDRLRVIVDNTEDGNKRLICWKKIYISLRKVVPSTLEEETRVFCFVSVLDFSTRQWEWGHWECGALILAKDILCVLLNSSVGLTVDKTEETMGESEVLSKHPLAQHQLLGCLWASRVSHCSILGSEWQSGIMMAQKLGSSSGCAPSLCWESPVITRTSGPTLTLAPLPSFF